jgi:hypothetical protein
VSESRNITSPAVKAINALPGARAIKLHGSIFMEAGNPDLLACATIARPYAEFFALEGKRIRKGPRVLQQRRLASWAAAGAVAGIFHTVAEAVAIVQGDEEARAAAFSRIGL